MSEHGDRENRLTHSQVQIWIGQQLNPRSPLYNMAFAWLISAPLDTDLLQRAWLRVVEQSDALRTRILESGGEGRVCITEPAACPLHVLDFRAKPDGVSAFWDWSRERCAQPLSLNGPLVDSVMVRLDAERIGWYLNLHHLITDAWSTVLLYRRFAQAYASLSGIDSGDARRPTSSYYATAAALAGRTSGRESARAHWALREKQAARAVPLYGYPAIPTGTESSRLTLVLDAARTQTLDKLCSQPGFQSLSRDIARFSLFATLLLAWLYRVSGRSDLSFDAPVAGRPSPEAKQILGLFIEMFPFAESLDNDDSFRSLGARCLAETERFLRHALPGASSPSGAGSGNVVLNYFPQAFGDFSGFPSEVRWVHPGHGDNVHALRLQVHDFNATGGLVLHFDFNEGVLPEQLRRRALTHFDKLLAALLENPDQQIASVDLLTNEERDQLRALNQTDAAPLPDRSVVALFRSQATACPERVALRDAGEEISFASLLEQVDALAATLIDRGVRPGQRVAIFGRRSAAMVIAVLATLRTRAAYVPIDPGYPATRVATLFSDSGASLLLLGGGEKPPGELAGAVKLAIDEGIEAGRGHTLDLRNPDLDELAYVLYTSGSTGSPKGVLIEHAGLSDYLLWASRQYVRGDRLTFPLFTSLSFDLTVTCLFLPLITGGTLEIYPESDGPVDSALMDVAKDNRVDFIKLTPSHLSLLRQLGLGGSQIRRMVVGGEDFKTYLAADVSAQLHHRIEIYNEYGPTEVVVGCVLHRYDPQLDHDVSVPIGRPADHVEVEILNDALVSVTQGTPGELWVTAYGLARGYHGLDELTAERFLPRPDRPEQRRYRTGDRVRLDERGNLHYLGRADRQIKVSGFRIEPGEIETAVLDLPGIEQCSVLAVSQPTVGAASDEIIRHCTRCGLPSNFPDADFDEDNVCGLCRSYDRVKDHAQDYFGTLDDLRALFDTSERAESDSYDCMMLLSGGKDSTYALCQLVDLGLSVYAFCLDNGYVSNEAKANIARVTERLGVPVEFAATESMNDIFRDSLETFANVCNGCFKTIYTLSTNRALELGIPIIVTGLSRGQMFETRLTEAMFRDGRCSPDEVDAAVLAARKVYHRLDDEVFRSLDVQVFKDDRVFEQIRYVDFYRYCDVGLSEVYEYLGEKVSWTRPKDTGRSTNCRINDVGIYVHKKERGYHNYALPYSWDVRLGHKEREAALDELNDTINIEQVDEILAEVGYKTDLIQDPDKGPLQLAAFYVADHDVPNETIRLRLAERLPAHLIPTQLHRVEAIPLTAHGKVDEEALMSSRPQQNSAPSGRRPEGPVEEYLVEIWQQTLGCEVVSAEDDFFALGGTSLAAMQVMIALCDEFAIDIPLETLFLHPTLEGLARVAENRILGDAFPDGETATPGIIVPGSSPTF